MMKPELVVVGYLCEDSNEYPGSIERRVGGGAFFAAQAASLALERVHVVSRVGEEFPLKELRSNVERSGIQRSALPTMQTRLIYRMEDLSHREVSTIWGASKELTGEDIPLPWLLSTHLVLLSTMEPLQQRQILQHIRRVAPHVQVALDSSEFFLSHPETKAQVAENYRQADIVFANRHEYGGLQDVFSQVPRSVVKFDGDGAQYREFDRLVAAVPAPQVEVVDVTGAGDILAGTFLAHLAQGVDVENSLGLAVALASRSVTERGITHLFR